MGATRNVVLSVAAAGLLIVGLLVLIPQPVEAVKPLAPSVSMSDTGTSTDNNVKTTLTTQVLIPAGSLIPITYAEIIVADGLIAPTFSGGTVKRIDTTRIQAPCVATIVSISGAQNFGNLRGYGYDIIPDSTGYGYGYEFSGAGTDILGQYGYGTGYGYGSATADSTVTVTLEATNCPSGSAFTSTFRSLTFQAVIGASEGAAFASLPTTLLVRDPEAGFSTVSVANTDTTLDLAPSILDSGSITTYNMQFLAGTSFGDAFEYTTGTFLYTPDPNQVSTATTLTSALFTTNQAVPEGANVAMAFFDLDSTGGTTFPTGSTAFGIPAADLATRAGGASYAGFFSITMSGLPAGSTPGAFVDVLVTLDIPTSYFTGTQTTANFHLERYSDAGVFQGTVSCTFTGAGATSVVPGNGPTNRFTCNITDFSSFAMVASAITGGGGGGGGGIVSSSSSSSSSISDSVSDSGSQTTSGTDSTSGSVSSSSTKGKGKGGSAPGLEFGLLVGALAGIALLARRQLK